MITFTEAIFISFGKFQNQKISFADGLQVIYGENEAGKSTLQRFFRVMLYGCNSRKRNTTVKEREYVIPWGETSAKGILRLNHDGRPIEIYRKIGKTPAGDELTVSDVNTGESLTEYISSSPGETIFHLSEEAFAKTFWLGQSSAFFQGKDDEIGRKLFNLQRTGDEEISAGKVLDVLGKEEDRLIAKNKKNSGRVINTLYEERERKLIERQQILSEREQGNQQKKALAAAEQELSDAETAVLELTRLIQKKEELSQKELLRKKQEETARLTDKYRELVQNPAYIKGAGISEETIYRAENLESELKTLDQMQTIGYDIRESEEKCLTLRKTRYRPLFVVGFGILVLLFGVLFAMSAASYASVVLGISIAVCFGAILFGGMNYFRIKQQMNDTQLQLREKFAKQKDLQEKYVKLQKQLQEILTTYQCNSLKELQKLFSAYREIQIRIDDTCAGYRQLCGEDISINEAPTVVTEPECNQEEIELLHRDLISELNAMQEKKHSAMAQIKEIEGKLSYVYRETQNPADITAEIAAIDDDIRKAEQRLCAVRLARDVFSDVYEKRKTDFTPLINEKVRENLVLLTAGAHEKVRVSDDYTVRLTDDESEAVPAEALSTGAMEQVYLSLRLALGSLIGCGCEPIFLDDCLVTFDDTRGEAAISLLQDVAQKNNRQIFLFTCHGREARSAREKQVKVLDIKEEMNHVG